MSVLDTIRGFFGAATPGSEENASKLDSGPLPSGAITVTLDPTSDGPRFIRDLNLHLFPGVAVDLGFYYTQKQIFDSNDLKSHVARGIVSIDQIGTTPSLEPISLEGATITAEVDLDPDTDGVKVYGTDGVSNVQVATDDAGIVQVNPTALPPGAATEATLQNILETLGGAPANPRTFFGTATLLYNTPGDIMSMTVPAGFKFRVRNIRAWSCVEAEYYVKDGSLAQVDGYRTTAANITMDIDTELVFYAGETVHIGAVHLVNSAIDFKASICGVLEALP